MSHQRLTMNMINRHNYEEYFILYMDNELSTGERCQVEAFVQQHPDLKEELDLLLQYKLVPDANIIFAGKEELMKDNGNTPISLSNYDEWMVLYMDNELSAKQKKSVEQFITANLSLKEEFSLLQKTKLQPEKLIFADKTSLYRRVEKARPLPFRRWRVAAAAVFLLGIGITTALVVNKKSSGIEIAKGTILEKKTIIESPAITPKEANSQVNESIVADNTNVLSPVVNQTSKSTTTSKERNNVAKNQLPVYSPLQQIKEEPLVVITKPTNDLPQPLFNPNINKNDATDKAVAIDNTPKEIKQQHSLTNSIVTTQSPSSSEIVNASYTNTDADFDQSDSKKNKNRGFFRKIARTFEKRTDIDPTDDNRLLVAGLVIKLK